MTTPSDAEMRAAFEAWACPQITCYTPEQLRRHRNGGYVTSEMNKWWRVWQPAWMAARGGGQCLSK